MNNKINTKLVKFFNTFRNIKYKKGQTILRPEDDPQGVYYINKGFVTMNAVRGGEKDLIVNIFKPGSYFPMTWAISNIDNNHFYVAKTETHVSRAPKEKVLSFLKTNPDELFILTNRILIGLDGLLTNIEFMLFGKAYHRVLGALYICSKRFGERDNIGGVLINLPLTHQEIANISGLSRETVSINMKILEKDNLIASKKKLIYIKNILIFEKELGYLLS